MADPVTMAMVGAGIGAATNKDDPLKGAMMGAAIGGIGGAGYGALAGEAAAGETAGELITSPMVSNVYPMTGAEAFPVPDRAGGLAVLPDQAYQPSDLSWMDTISKSQEQAIGTGALPGMGGLSPMAAMQAANLLKPQQQPQVSGSVRRGNPQALNDAVISLLAPKQIAKRKISLL